MTTEGVIKFQNDHAASPLSACAAERIGPLVGWRGILRQLSVLGRDPARYGGAAFGNASVRVPPFPGERGARRFVITASQTGERRQVGPEAMSLVLAYDAARNWLKSQGPMPPSSEALTHAAIYDVDPRIRCVLHVHAPRLWREAARLRLPTTAPQVDYGTPEMASEVARLYRETRLSELRLLAMGGHEDGIISFGRNPNEAGEVLVRYLALAD